MREGERRSWKAGDLGRCRTVRLYPNRANRRDHTTKHEEEGKEGGREVESARLCAPALVERFGLGPLPHLGDELRGLSRLLRGKRCRPLQHGPFRTRREAGDGGGAKSGGEASGGVTVCAEVHLGLVVEDMLSDALALPNRLGRHAYHHLLEAPRYLSTRGGGQGR